MELQGGLICEKWTIFHITSGKIKISLSNRFGAFLPRFRSLNVLYKHLDGLGLLLGSPNGGQLKKSDSESIPYCKLSPFLTIFGTFSSILNTFFGIFELVQASGRMVGADTIPRPPQSYNHKNLRQCSIKYKVQNEVAAQTNSWRARRRMH